MSTQRIAVETMVVSGLQNLFADESELASMFDKLSDSPTRAGSSQILRQRLLELDRKATRIDRLLDAIG